MIGTWVKRDSKVKPFPKQIFLTSDAVIIQAKNIVTSSVATGENELSKDQMFTDIFRSNYFDPTIAKIR